MINPKDDYTIDFLSKVYLRLRLNDLSIFLDLLIYSIVFLHKKWSKKDVTVIVPEK